MFGGSSFNVAPLSSVGRGHLLRFDNSDSRSLLQDSGRWRRRVGVRRGARTRPKANARSSGWWGCDGGVVSRQSGCGRTRNCQRCECEKVDVKDRHGGSGDDLRGDGVECDGCGRKWHLTKSCLMTPSQQRRGNNKVRCREGGVKRRSRRVQSSEQSNSCTRRSGR